MKRFVPRLSITNIHAIRAVVVAILSLAAVTNCARGQLYGIEYDTGNLYRISTANAALSLVGNTGISNLGSLEYRPSNGLLYAIRNEFVVDHSVGSLYRINPANASVTLVGSLGPQQVGEGGLVIAPDGTAYATQMNFSDNPTLFKINLDTAATTTVGTISGGVHDINGLAWRSDNMLVGLDRVTDSLLAINPSTAASSVIAVVSAPIGGVGGMAAVGDSGYFATGNFNGSNSLYSFNLNSGAHALIGSFSPTIAGVGIGSLALVVPEPASLSLAVLAIVPLFVRRRRPQVKTPNFFGCRDRNASSAVSAVALCWSNRSRAFSKLTFVASLILFSAISLVALQSASAVTISTVPIGNLGNANDPLTGNSFGGVAYSYRIGTTEVTNAQYAAFLNQKAKSDPLGLYNVSMGSTSGGITKSGPSPNFLYTPIAGRGNMPVNFVSWYDSIRFANWLNNGQGTGDTETGAYTLTDTTITRNSSATWFLPSLDEWYKAAYHKNDGVAGNYFVYPTSNDAVPTGGAPPGGSNSANFGFNLGVGDLTNVGSYIDTKSPYGAFDMAGNVTEWLDDSLVGSGYRSIWGGSWSGMAVHTRSDYGMAYIPQGETGSIGFRVATVPAVLLGDFNGNGFVDAADYVAWRKTDGTPAGYNTWRTHFGQPSGSSAGATANYAVPEPTTLVLVMFAAAVWFLRRGRAA